MVIEERCHKSWLGLVAQLHVTLLSRKGNSEILWFFFNFCYLAGMGIQSTFVELLNSLSLKGIS